MKNHRVYLIDYLITKDIYTNLSYKEATAAGLRHSRNSSGFVYVYECLPEPEKDKLKHVFYQGRELHIY